MPYTSRRAGLRFHPRRGRRPAVTTRGLRRSSPTWLARLEAGHNRRVRLVPWIPPLFRDREAAGRALSEAVAALGGLRLGAVSAQGPPYLREGHGVPEEAVESALERARRAAEALEARLELETFPVAGRTTVLVDDGLITGLTLAAASRWARAKEAARLIAATPVGQVAGLARLRTETDLVVCPRPLEEIAVVGQAYDIFDPLDEWYVAGLLADAAAGAAE